MSLRNYIFLWLATMLLFCGVFMIVYEVGHGTFDRRSVAMIGLLSMLIALFVGLAIDCRP